MLLCWVALIGCLYPEILVELGMWLGYDPQFNSVNIFFHFFFPFALAFLGSVSPLYLFAHILVILHMCSLFYIICNWTGFWQWNQPLQPRQPVSSRFTLFTPFISPPSYPSRWESGWPHQSVCPGPRCPGSKGVWLVVSPLEPESEQLERATAAELQ